MPNRGKVLVHSRNDQTMARFLPSRYKVLWALRVSRRAPAKRSEVGGTRVVESRSQVKVYKVLTEALERSRYKVVGPDIRSMSKRKNPA